MSRDRLPDAIVLRTIGSAVMLLALALLFSCQGSDPVDLGVDLPELRIPGSDRLAEEPWVAHVAVLDEGVKVRLEFEPADGGSRKRMLKLGEDLPIPVDLVETERITGTRESGQTLRRTAIVLHAGPDQLCNATLRGVPHDGFSETPRLFLAGRREGVVSLPFLVPPHDPEIEVARLGAALQPQDLTRGLRREAATFLRITRGDGQVRYRWACPEREAGESRWSGGDVVLTDAEVRGTAPAPQLAGLISALSGRHHWTRYSVAVVFMEISDEALIVDVMRAVECARGDAEVVFYPVTPSPWGWHGEDRQGSRIQHSIRVPRADRKLQPATWFLSLKDRNEPFRFSLDRDGRTALRNWPWPADKLGERLSRYRESRPTGWQKRIVLRIDERTPWALARPWMTRSSASGIELALRFQHGDRWLDSETELRLPGKPGGERLPMMAAEAESRAKEARDRIVVLSAPDTATVDDVWQAALLLMDAGAAGIEFE